MARALGRESESLLLDNLRMKPLAPMWFVFDVSLTMLRQVPWLGVLAGASLAIKTQPPAALSKGTPWLVFNVLRCWCAPRHSFLSI